MITKSCVRVCGAYLHTLADIQVIAEADSGTAAVSAVEQHQPDVVLMDLEMPGELDGIVATRQIRKTRPETQVIVVTSHHQDEYIFPRYGQEQSLICLKMSNQMNLLPPSVKPRRVKPFSIPGWLHASYRNCRGLRKEDFNPFTALSEREFDVLRLIAAGKSNAEIAETLVIGESTVKTHIGNLLRKLHLEDRTQAAVYAWQEGIVRRGK